MRRKILCLLAVVVASLSILEAGARIFRWFRIRNEMTIADPVLHHVWKPSTKLSSPKIIDKDRSIPRILIVNKQSWVVDHDVTLAKPNDTYRIFYVGDSNTAGAVSFEDSMVERVKKRLNEMFADKGVKFEVINTGTTSYSFLPYYVLIKTKILAYSPDLVVLNIDMTDVVNDAVYRKFLVKDGNGDIVAIKQPYNHRYIMMPEGYVEIEPRSWFYAWAISHSDLSYIVDQVFSRKLLMEYGRQLELKVDKSANWLEKNWTGEITENVNESMAVLRRTIELLRSRGARVVITGVPHYPQYTGRWSAKPHRVLEQIAKDENAPFLNSYEALREKISGTSVEQYYWSDDPTHFNREGNRIWADVQLKFLLDKKNELLPFERLK